MPFPTCAMTKDDLIERAERCRRLALMATDTHLRNSLEALAEEYEAQLPPSRRSDVSFMLRHR
jgi:hypothetical protein